MSLARLAAVACRGAARVGALADVARPTPDAIAALDAAAATEAAGRADPASRRASSPPTLPPPRQPPPRATLVAPPAPDPGPSDSLPAGELAGGPRAVPGGGQAQPPEVTVATSHDEPERLQAIAPTVMPVARSDAGIEPAPTRSVATPAATPPPAIGATQPPRVTAHHDEPQPVIPAPSPLPASEAANVTATKRADPAPLLVPVLPSIADASHAPAAGSENGSDTSIVIDQIEIVMAPPPRPPPAPKPVPDRGFARYAAMRSARDRARW